MSSLWSLCLCVLVLCLLMSSYVCGVTIILADEYGSEVGLPTSGGHATGGFTISNALFSLSPYNLTVYVTNEFVSYEGKTSNQVQSFYVIPSYGEAQLIGSYFEGGVLDLTTNTVSYSGIVLSGDYIGSSMSPNTAVGRYTYEWTIPLFQALNAQIVYSNVGNPTVTDYVTVNVINSAKEA